MSSLPSPVVSIITIPGWTGVALVSVTLGYAGAGCTGCTAPALLERFGTGFGGLGEAGGGVEGGAGLGVVMRTSLLLARLTTAAAAMARCRLALALAFLSSSAFLPRYKKKAQQQQQAHRPPTTPPTIPPTPDDDDDEPMASADSWT